MLAGVAVLLPRLVALPLAAVALWLGLALLFKAYRLRKAAARAATAGAPLSR